MTQTCPRCGEKFPGDRLTICPHCLLDESGEDTTRELSGGKVVLGDVIGSGGMGTVFRAEHVGLGRPVAVKFLPEALAHQEEFQRRFEREAHALAMLNHPNILTVHDFGEDDGRHYIVMELAGGGSLADKLPLEPQRVLEITLQITAALSYAHDEGVVHRDIKPQNVLLDSSGRVKVSDFGLARILGSDTLEWVVTAPGQAVGTPHFMAPEALAGSPPDLRMDIYSLGVLLYQMLTGQLPTGNYAPPPRPFARIVSKALAQDPTDRYQSAGEMQRDLEGARPLARDAAEPRSGVLPPDEKNWLRGVALLESVATAVPLWAFMECLTPKVLEPGQVRSLVMLGTKLYSDGRVFSPVRFETWPILAALVAVVVGLFTYTILRQYWKRAGLESQTPGQRIPEVRCVLLAGVAASAVFALAKWLEWGGRPGFAVYAPLVGGAIEVAWLYCLWVSILEASRTGRVLWRDPYLWVGSVLALIPPVTEFARDVLSAQPD